MNQPKKCELNSLKGELTNFIGEVKDKKSAFAVFLAFLKGVSKIGELNYEHPGGAVCHQYSHRIYSK